MSVVDSSRAFDEVQFDQLPEFELECMYDDWNDPTDVTIYSTDDDDNLYTVWITVDRDHAVPLADVR